MANTAQLVKLESSASLERKIWTGQKVCGTELHFVKKKKIRGSSKEGVQDSVFSWLYCYSGTRFMHFIFGANPRDDSFLTLITFIFDLKAKRNWHE